MDGECDGVKVGMVDCGDEGSRVGRTVEGCRVGNTKGKLDGAEVGILEGE